MDLLEIPRIIEDVDFNAVHDRLDSNHPLTTSPRIVNSNILLTGLAHCAQCHPRMRIQTGKGGAYRYYKCGKHADSGKAVCTGCSVRMEKLDKIVLNVLIDRILAPGRISPLFERSLDRERTVQNRIKQLKSDKREMKKQLDALWRQTALARFAAGCVT